MRCPRKQQAHVSSRDKEGAKGTQAGVPGRMEFLRALRHPKPLDQWPLKLHQQLQGAGAL